MFTFRKIISVLIAIVASTSGCGCREIGRNADSENEIEAEVRYYEKLISDELAKALKYELPTNAKMHEPSVNVIRDFGTFDFVIIGAGSTGSVIASRLSEISKWRILLLEAGKYPNNFTMIPGYFAIQAMTEYNWGFLSTPQKTSCLGAEDHRCNVPRGKGLGGTSLINELVYSRGNRKDYDKWACLLNDNSWSYENVLPYFKKSEDFHKTNPIAPIDWEYHGQGGYLYTNHHEPPSNWTEIFLNGNEEMGIDVTDYNGEKQVGATILQINTKHGRRFDQVSAFVKPVRDRQNLFVEHESFAIKIEIDDITKQTTGILFTKHNKTYRAKIDKELILSAGAFQSPQLLMLSGIGPQEHLKRLNIPVIKNLSVGSSLREHVYCGVQFSSNHTTAPKNLQLQLREYLNGYGTLAAANQIEVAGFYSTKIEEDPEYPDIEMVLSSSSSSELGRKFSRTSNETWNALYNINITNPFTFTTVLLKSDSAGTVRLQSSDPYDYPLIDFNLLNDANGQDIDRVYEGIKFALDITQTDAFKNIAPILEVRPLPACSQHIFLSKNYWYCYIRQISTAAYHPVGTCPTGTDPDKGAVVDQNLNVYGIKGLRVADASVFPFTLAGQPAAACTMIGEKVSDVIKILYE